MLELDQSALGQRTAYKDRYDASLLFPIARIGKRQEIGINGILPFEGFDRWQHYEVSWLNNKGKPQVAVAEIIYPCTSPNIIESKSMKLYFNSLNNTPFADAQQVQAIVQRDLSSAVGSRVMVSLRALTQVSSAVLRPTFDGLCLDDLDVMCDRYTVDASLLSTTDEWVIDACVYSDLLKSNCLVTHQPDWGSVCIRYTGRKIDPAGLLKYLVSFRNHNEFHEQCIERIFIDITRHCQPTALSVDGRYTRRGGLDINPYRSSHAIDLQHSFERLCRQ